MKDNYIEKVLAELTAAGDIEDPRAYLAEAELDEPPLYTRLSHIAFLRSLTLDETNRTLFGAALNHADRIVTMASTELTTESLREYMCLITIMEWSGIEPIVPRFLVSTRAHDELGKLRLGSPRSPEAMTTMRWLRELGRGSEFIVKEDVVPPTDPELLRVYVGHAKLPHPVMRSIRDIGIRST